MGAIRLAISNSTDEEYGGNIEPVIEKGTATISIPVDSGSYISWIKKGNVVDVELALTTTATVSATDVIATGLPKAVINTDIGFAFKRITNSSGVDGRVLLQNSGDSARLVNFYGRRIDAIGGYEGNFMYIAE
jgi:hypothetical protein